MRVCLGGRLRHGTRCKKMLNRNTTFTWKQLWGHTLDASPEITFSLCFIEHFKRSLLPPAVRLEGWTRLLLHNELKDTSALQGGGKMCGPRKATCKFISV